MATRRQSYSAPALGLLIARRRSVSSAPRLVPHQPSPLEWRELAPCVLGAAAKERARAAEIAGPDARGFVLSADAFERLAERCLEMTRPAPE
jgi:hypothetical protein